MFTKYPQTEIKKYWEVLKAAMLENLPPTTMGIDVDTDVIFAKLMSDEMQMWIFVNKESDTENSNGAKGFIITAYASELGFNFKTLLIYAVVATIHIDEFEWKEAYATLKSFARKNKCLKLVAFSANPRVTEVVNFLGGDSSHNLLVLEV